MAKKKKKLESIIVCEPVPGEIHRVSVSKRGRLAFINHSREEIIAESMLCCLKGKGCPCGVIHARRKEMLTQLVCGTHFFTSAMFQRSNFRSKSIELHKHRKSRQELARTDQVELPFLNRPSVIARAFVRQLEQGTHPLSHYPPITLSIEVGDNGKRINQKIFSDHEGPTRIIALHKHWIIATHLSRVGVIEKRWLPLQYSRRGSIDSENKHRYAFAVDLDWLVGWRRPMDDLWHRQNLAKQKQAPRVPLTRIEISEELWQKATEQRVRYYCERNKNANQT